MTDRDVRELVGQEIELAYAAPAEAASTPAVSPSEPAAGNPAGGPAAGRLAAFGVARRQTRFRIAGIVEREPGPMVGIFAPVMLPLGRMQKLGAYGLGGPGALLEPELGGRSYPSVTVRVARPRDVEDVEKRVRDLGFSAFSLVDALAGAKRAFILLDILLALIGSIALAVASLGIVNTMIMSILERTREIGIMKAIGGADADIRGIFLVEASIIGLVGGLAGLLLGWVVGRGVNYGANAYIRSQGGPTGELFSAPWWLGAGAVAFAIAVSLVAGSYPAARAARLDPIRALRHD
jgi:putative ABC transport system permease protein